MQLARQQDVFVQEIGQLAARVGAITVENQRRLIRPLGALERAIGFWNRRPRLLPQLLPARAIDRVERLERPAAQLAHLGGPGAAGLGGQRGVVQVTANLPFDRLVAVAGHLRDHHGARQDQRKAGAGQQPPPVARRRIVFQRRDERGHRRPALRRIGLEPAQHRPPDPGGHLAVLAHRFDVALGHVVQQLQQRPTVKRAFAVERLVEGHAKTELIGALVGRLADDLLGRHVCGRPHDRPGPRERLQMVAGALRRRRERDRVRFVLDTGGRFARQSEIDDPGAAVLVQQHVLRLEVAVHQPRRMRSRQAPPRGDEDVQHLAPGARAGAEPALERPTAQEFHGQEDLPVEDADVVHGDHVRVRQPRHRLRLAQQARPRRVFLTELASLEELERDLSIELRIVGAVHDAHGAAAHALDDQVAPDPGTGVERRPLARWGYRLLTTGRHRIFICERPVKAERGFCEKVVRAGANRQARASSAMASVSATSAMA